jgi:hypothetical protein
MKYQDSLSPEQRPAIVPFDQSQSATLVQDIKTLPTGTPAVPNQKIIRPLAYSRNGRDVMYMQSGKFVLPGHLLPDCDVAVHDDREVAPLCKWARCGRYTSFQMYNIYVM